MKSELLKIREKREKKCVDEKRRLPAAGKYSTVDSTEVKFKWKTQQRHFAETAPSANRLRVK